jgi:hypothetical protein
MQHYDASGLIRRGGATVQGGSDRCAIAKGELNLFASDARIRGKKCGDCAPQPDDETSYSTPSYHRHVPRNRKAFTKGIAFVNAALI